MNRDILEIAMKVLQITEDEVMKNSKPLAELDAFYIWNPIRGGGSLIINSKGEKLGAGSSINFEMHKKAFIDGKRN
jgi:hypothetical protein